jgi:hypothetical protein
VTADVIPLPVTAEPVAPLDRFATEEARQAYFAGYADAMRDSVGVEVGRLAANEPGILAGKAARRLHLHAVPS